MSKLFHLLDPRENPAQYGSYDETTEPDPIQDIPLTSN